MDLMVIELIVRKPVHPMRHLNDVLVVRAVTLLQEGWTFRRVAVNLNVLSVSYSTFVQSL